MGNINNSEICWKGKHAEHKRSMRFMVLADNNFLTGDSGDDEGTQSPGPELPNKKGLVRDAKVEGSLSCSDQEMVTPKSMVILMYK